MLHFMENHDEQRIASSFFAGDPLKAVPAMVISATVDSGPVMIYFGQEVGEPAAGNPGFQNIENQGVTTKMDYWGVPELQKWVNGGAYDGGLLSEEQKRLRQFYSSLLNIAQKNAAITAGAYYDITEANIPGNMGENVHAFIRANGSERLLIVTSFAAQVQHIKINIPEDVASSIRLTSADSYVAKDILWGTQELKIEQLTCEFDIPASGAFIFKIQ